MPLKPRHFKGVLDTIKKVVVRRGKGKTKDLDAIVLGGSAEGADDTFVGVETGAKESPAVDSPGAGLDQGALRRAPPVDVAQRT